MTLFGWVTDPQFMDACCPVKIGQEKDYIDFMMVLVDGESTVVGYVTLTMLLPLLSHFSTVFLQKHLLGTLVLHNPWPWIDRQWVWSMFLWDSSNVKTPQKWTKWELSLCKRLPGSTSDRHSIMKFDEISANQNYSTCYLKYHSKATKWLVAQVLSHLGATGSLNSSFTNKSRWTFFSQVIALWVPRRKEIHM